MKRVRTEAEKVIDFLMTSHELDEGEKARVMIVEDDNEDAYLMERAISDLAQVERTTNAEDAIRLFHARPGWMPHLMFVDLNLPKMTGLDLMRLIRQTNPKIYLVLVTGAPPTMDQMEEALEGGRIEIVKKPLSRDDARAIIQAHAPK